MITVGTYRDAPRTASDLEEEVNTEFEISVVSKIFSPKKRPCQISKARQTLLQTLFWAAQPAFASKISSKKK